MAEQRPPASDPAKHKYVLRLFVAGRSSNAAAALRNVTRFCEHWLRGRYELRVVDVLKEPEAAACDGIVATPTLVKQEPAPPVRLFGTLASEEELLAGLGIERAAQPKRTPPKQAAEPSPPVSRPRADRR